VPELENLAAAPPGAPAGSSTDGPPWHPLLVAVVPLVTAVGAALYDAAQTHLAGPPLTEGQDVPLLYEGHPVGTVRVPPPTPVPPLQHALERLLQEAAATHGGPLDALDRTDKQRVVADLDARGAFVLRKAVEDVADALGVSRFTVYNYLARSQDAPTDGRAPDGTEAPS
jgi:hypothetical protein